MNKCTIVGVVSANLVYTHKFNGKDYYAMVVDVERESNYLDKINVFVSKDIVENSSRLISTGDKVIIKGKLINSNLKEYRDVSLLANNLELANRNCNIINNNEIIFSGVISQLYDTKELPKYNKKVKIMIIKNEDDNRITTLKVSAWNKYADYIDSNYKIGDKVTIICRLEGKKLYNDESLILHEGSLITIVNR